MNQSPINQTQLSLSTNKLNDNKPVMSPPTPMLLLPPQSSEDSNEENDNYATNITNNNNTNTNDSNLNDSTNNTNSTNINPNKESKTLALIEANDSIEMNLILNTIKQIFPSINVHICNNTDEKIKKEQQDNKSYLTVSRNCSSPDYSKANNRNSLNIKLYDNANNLSKVKSGDRASSIDNSSLASNLSIERQESKDSGFWTRTKCSFESMKSLSISDHKSPVSNETNNINNTNSLSSTNNTDNNNIETKTSNSNSTLGLKNTSNVEINDNKNYLASPRSSLGYNWKKWKKGQAWRYSSSNTNLADNNNTTVANGINNPNSDANMFRTNNASFNSDNSSFSIERTEDESNESYSNTNNNNSYFSNSFELATSKLSLLSHQVSLQPWASTSKLDSTSDTIETSQNSSQKRRGKLVRDRTIDTPDEQTAPQFNFISTKETNVKFASNTNLNSNDESSERVHKDGSPVPTCCSTPFKDKEKTHQNGRISPPEKRLSLSFKYDETTVAKENEAEKIASILKSEEVQNAIHAALNANNKLDQNDLKKIIANILSTKFAYNEELVKQIAEMNTNDINMLNQPRLTSSPASSCPSPVSPLSSNLIPTVKKLSLLSSQSSKSISPNNSTQNIQYDFHKDLQSKLNIKTEVEDIQDDLKTTYNSINQQYQKIMHQNELNNQTSSSLSPNYNKNSILKNLNSASFDFKFINNNNYLTNGLVQSTNKAIYRSNSSPSYSSQIVDPATQLTSPSFTKNNIEMNSDLTHLDQTKLNSSTLCFQQPQKHQQQPPPPPAYFPFNFNFNKSLPQSTTNLNYSYDPHLQLHPHHHHHQQQQHQSPHKFFSDLNNFYPNFDFAKQLANTNRLIKPPEIVITESKTDSFQIDYDDAENKKLEFQSNQNNNLTNVSNIKNEIFSNEAVIRSNEINRNKFINNTFYFSQTFENSLLKKQQQQPSPDSTSSTFLNNETSFWSKTATSNHSKLDVKSSNTTSSTSSSSTTSSVASSKSLKPHICPSCQKRFARSDMLIRHSRLHSGVRPYRCNRCGQEFSRSDHLNTHLRTHTGEKPYTCPHPKCSYAACRKDMITRHLKVHSKNAVNRLSLSFDSAKLPEKQSQSNSTTNPLNVSSTKLLFDTSLVAPVPNVLNTNLSLSSKTFSLLNRMETTQLFENNNNSNNINKSTSSLTSF